MRFNVLTRQLLHQVLRIVSLRAGLVLAFKLSRTGYKNDREIDLFLERGISFWGKFFLKRGPNLECRAAHTQPHTPSRVWIHKGDYFLRTHRIKWF